jgi:hypothetical protein
MKRHLQAQPPAPLPIPTLSLEEAAILADEENEASIVADAAAADTDRIAEVADIANDTMLVVDETPEIGQVEQELVNAVGEMAVAGTDDNPEDVISMPVADGQDISVEGIVSALKSIWDAIITAIKNMWVGLKHWLTTYFSSLEQNKKHAEDLIKRLSAMKGYLANDGAALTSHIVDIFNYSGNTWLDFFNVAGKNDEDFRTYVLEAAKNQHALMGQIGIGMEQAFQGYDGVNVADTEDVVNTLGKTMNTYMQRLKLEPEKGDKWTSKKIANMTVTAKNYSANWSVSGTNLETKIAMLSKVRFEVDQVTEFGSTKGRVMKNDTTPEMLLPMVQKRLDFINELLKFKGDQFKSLETTMDKVQKACDEMLGRIKDDNKEATAFAKRLMGLCSAYANWATQPTAKLFSVAARHNKFFLSFYEMATNNFQKA